MFLNFEKALKFDTVEWSVYIKNSKLFQFRIVINKLDENVLCNIESCVLNNGWASDYFTPEKVVRARFPFPLIFSLFA